MSLIEIENLTFGYASSPETVFEGLNLRLDSNWRLGLVGRNGRGKSTLLGLMSGQLKPNKGRVRAPGLRPGAFPPPVEQESAITREILRALAPQAQDWEIEREARLLGLAESVISRPFYTLSGGERVKVLLISLFLQNGVYPLLDEPTAHLDLEARQCVSKYLSCKQGFLLVSHDRDFLDGCVDHILALNKTGPEICNGNFAIWHAEKQARDRAEQAENQRLMREIGRLNQAASRTATWSDKVEASKQGTRNSGLRPDKGYIGHKSAKMMQRAQSIEARKRAAAKEKAALLKDIERADPLKLTPLRYRSDTLLRVEGVSICYPGAAPLAAVSFALHNGARLALRGGNGAGKTSLLQLLAGKAVPHAGRVRLGSGLLLSYVPQRTDGLTGKPLDYARALGLDQTRFLTILRKLDFERALFERDMEGYSQGQKKKVLLAQSLSQDAHAYLWDEPLGYIDLFSRVQLEELILGFCPTLLFVEHDGAFLRAIATEEIWMGKG
ncbi:MAG: ATP-binding cassette domain-containing protein [Candidatus Pelethousia sp.]|nr:ATP-binding cassette domain-containing protein [Candidatus Pelethousia sp.]